MTDPIADMLTRIRNAVMIKQRDVTMPFSGIKFEIGKILEQEGFIGKIEEITDSDSQRKSLLVHLRYKDEEPVLRGIKRISKPGLRVYKSFKEIPRVLPSLGVLIVSTSGGLVTNSDAKKQRVGGEILCEVY